MAVPIVTIFVRHSATCKYAGDEFHKQCKCRKHLRWSYAGKQYRQSAKTRSWDQAEKEKKKIEAGFDPALAAAISQNGTGSAQARKTISEAIQLFIAERRGAGCGPDILKKYERELDGRITANGEKKSAGNGNSLREFLSTKCGRLFVDEILPDDLILFRDTWEDAFPSVQTRIQVQARVRAFLRFCMEKKYTDRVLKLSPIKGDREQPNPLTEAEYTKLLDTIPNEFDSEKAKKVRALVQLMRHSGLAIRDAVTLERDEIQREDHLHRIVTTRQKTGSPVNVPIPDDVAKEVLTVLNGNPRYVFWNTGKGLEVSAVTNWQHDLRLLFRSAFGQETEFTPHSLRHTFAVSLLTKGVPMGEVSKALGHESIKTTEKYYAKWDKGRQNRLDSLIVQTWQAPAPAPGKKARAAESR